MYTRGSLILGVLFFFSLGGQLFAQDDYSYDQSVNDSYFSNDSSYSQDSYSSGQSWEEQDYNPPYPDELADYGREINSYDDAADYLENPQEDPLPPGPRIYNQDDYPNDNYAYEQDGQAYDDYEANPPASTSRFEDNFDTSDRSAIPDLSALPYAD